MRDNVMFQASAQDILIRHVGDCSPSKGSRVGGMVARESMGNINALIDFRVCYVVSVSVFQGRSLDEDLRSMMCSDALVTAKSTLFFLSAYHTVAPTVYTAETCDAYHKKYPPIDRPGVEVRDCGCGR